MLQYQIVKRTLTSNPHLQASKELLSLVQRIFYSAKEEFTVAFNGWCDKWEDFLNERTTLLTGTTIYTHRRLRTARRSVKMHLKWLFIFEEYPGLNIPKKTNMLEGYNSQLKRALANHNGTNETNKKKYIDAFLNIKKEAGNKPACQMSITP